MFFCLDIIIRILLNKSEHNFTYCYLFINYTSFDDDTLLTLYVCSSEFSASKDELLVVLISIILFFAFPPFILRHTFL